jgi:hypothetical protein
MNETYCGKLGCIYCRPMKIFCIGSGSPNSVCMIKGLESYQEDIVCITGTGTVEGML